MDLLFGLGILVLLVLPLAIAIKRSIELFVLRVQQGELKHIRGRLPSRLLEDIRDVLAKPTVKQALIRVITENGNPCVIASGDVSETQAQQLWNVVGTYRTPQIRGGRRPGWGQSILLY